MEDKKDSSEFKSLVKQVQKLEKQMKDNLPEIRESIDNIIKGKITSIQIIEKTLDVLLNYVQIGIGVEEFNRLNRYYFTINSENSKQYENYYKEIIEER